MPLGLNLLSCPKCGGKLKEAGEGRYICSFCERVWEKEIDDTFDKILGGVETALIEQRASDVARLKRALYDETHKKFISNREVERVCRDILNHYDDEDFYARFYLATCDDNRTAFSAFCENCNIASHRDDVADILDYLITGMREEWISNISDIIEKAYKGYDTNLYSKYRNKFEEMAERVNEGIYEPTLHRDVFVMYSGKDMDKVLKMVSVLENDYGLTCFVAAKNLRHGSGSTDRYKDAIHTAIKNCDIYLLISSNNSRSRQCEVYEEVMYIMDNFPERPRVEYLAEDYKGYGMERKFKEFFSGLEWCISYEDTAERISDYCDMIQRGQIFTSDTSSSKEIDEEPAPKAEVKTESLDIPLAKAKRLLILKKYKEAFEEYERLADEHPDDIRPYIGMVRAISENYTKEDSSEAELHINVINGFFGEGAGVEEDPDFADYLIRLEKAKKTAAAKKEAQRKAEEEARSAKESLAGRLSEAKDYYYGRNGKKQDYKKAFPIFKELAEKGDADAQNHLGLSYEHGYGVATDIALAIKWFRKAVDQGYSYAQNNLGVCYENGEGVTKDIYEAARLYRLAADQGCSLAQCNLAYCYEKGNGVSQSYAEALKWYRKGADQNHPRSLNNLGILYENGYGVTKDITEAARLYKKAAEQNYAVAQCNLAYCYEKGNGVSQSYSEAVKWYGKSSDLGNARASNNLGLLYENGNGVTKDIVKAASLYRKAADTGYAIAQCNLGYCYEKGNGVPQNNTEAAKWYKKSADQGNTRAQHNLAVCYEFGKGVTKSMSEAVRLYRLAADKGYAAAQCNLGYCYDMGNGVAQSYSEAVKWYRKAADQGNIRAQNNLGYCYEKGNGVAQSYSEAVKLYKRSVEKGSDWAQCQLGYCYDKGYGVTQNYSEAIRLYRLAANQGNVYAQNNLGICYEVGKGVTKSISEAVKWYRLSAKNGHASAKDNLKRLGYSL